MEGLEGALRPFGFPKGRRRPRIRRALHLRRLVGPSRNIAPGTDQGRDGNQEEMLDLSLVQCNMPWNDRDTTEVMLKTAEVPVIEVDSATDIHSVDFCKDSLTNKARDGGSYLNGHIVTDSSAGPSSASSETSVVPPIECTASWLLPGNVVWAKTACHEWWPAEVMEARVALECTRNYSSRHVLVQLYGSLEHEWVDPDRDLSEFDCCYEERSKNPLKSFQEALKQALCKHSLASSRNSPQRSSPELNNLVEYGKKLDLSECAEEGRGKRKKKRKIHFDELTFTQKSKRKDRRLRIMRYLGLSPPVGSPFTLSHSKTAN
ncbi:uncharacterized protein LOC109712335 isoform X3 [Ananas comosus]|uniref:Uncharacterized protein LOC109712335 isoform X3 n=1 Tax=Ananas comosus TaxID=4615 RepID=A0A6P5F5K2_ANACO|nr:uncharacterized protein LOC109712335 isoform X3 [Ananas comosus]